MLASLLLCLAPHATQPAPQATLLREGAHFKVHCHFSDEDAADQALDTAEAVWDLTTKLYGFRKKKLKQPLEVHLYRTVADYEAIEKKLTRGKFKQNWAFSHIDSRSAHLILQPLISDETLARVGLPLLTQNLLAHEAMHLVSYVHLSDAEHMPDWIAEGTACYVAERSLRDRGLAGTAEEDPFLATSMGLATALVGSDQWPSVEDIMWGRLAALSSKQRYAMNWSLVRFMAMGKHKKTLTRVLKASWQLGGGSDFEERLQAKLLKLVSKSNFKKINKDFKAHMLGLNPRWEEVYRSLNTHGKQWVQTAFNKNAIAWRPERAGATYRVEGKLTLFAGDKQQLNVLLGREDSGFVIVAFSANIGVTLMQFDASTKAWQRHAFERSKELMPNQAFDFAVLVEQEHVAVEINGETLLETELPGVALDGPWGLGALRDSAGLWELRAAPGL